MVNLDKIMDVGLLAMVGIGGLLFLNQVKGLFGTGTGDGTGGGVTTLGERATDLILGGANTLAQEGLDVVTGVSKPVLQGANIGIAAGFASGLGAGVSGLVGALTAADSLTKTGAAAAVPAPSDVYREVSNAESVVKTLTSGTSLQKLNLINQAPSFVNAAGTTQKSIVYSSSGGTTSAKVSTKSASPVTLLKGQTYNKITGQVRDF